MSVVEIGLPEALERAASSLPKLADAIRPANGDPAQLAAAFDSDAAARLLGWLLEHEPSAGAELAEAWAEDPESAGALLALAPEGLPKDARKLLRRAHHRLRSRGVEMPEARPAATVAKLAPVDDKVDEARITALDPQGTRLLYLATAHPAGGVRLFELAIDDARGVLEFDLFETGRSRARRFLRSAERRERWPAVEVSPAAARRLISIALEAQPADQPPPRAFSEWRRRLCEVEPATPTPGEQVREALGGDEAPDLEAVSTWIREGRVGPWPPPLESLRPLLDRLDEIREGRVEISEAAREQQIDAALGEAIESAFDSDARELGARRFEETAYVWWRGQQEADARALLGSARALRERPPLETPIPRAMLETALAARLASARDPKGSDGAEPPAVGA